MHPVTNVLSNFLGEIRKHNKDKSQISFDCPACAADKGLSCGDGKGNLEINYKHNLFKCWVCYDYNRMQGSLEKLVKNYGNNHDYKNYKLLKVENDFEIDEVKPRVKLYLPYGFKLLKNSSEKDLGYEEAINYLKKRNIDEKLIEKYNIGFTAEDKIYKNRIVIPSYNEKEQLDIFIARWYLEKYNKFKYLIPEVDKLNIIFNKQLIDLYAKIYLVEGVMDHVVIPNSIPLLGTELSDHLYYFLQENAKSDIVIVLDPDAIKQAMKIFNELNNYNLYGRVKMVLPPNNYDPSKIYELLGHKGIKNLLKKEYIPK
jgi:hypothetical protein